MLSMTRGRGDVSSDVIQYPEGPSAPYIALPISVIAIYRVTKPVDQKTFEVLRLLMMGW